MISWRQQFMKFFSTNHFCVLLALKFACNPKNSPTTSFRSSVRFCFRTHVPFAISQMTTFLLPNLRTREFVWIDQNMYKRILNAGSIYCKSKFSWSCKWQNLCFYLVRRKFVKVSNLPEQGIFTRKPCSSEWRFTQLQQELIQTGTVCMNKSSKFNYLSHRHLS